MHNNFFILLLISHFIGDYYLQSAELAELKQQKFIYILKHGIIYSLPCLILLGLVFDTSLLLYFGAYIVSHIILDFLKSVVLKSRGLNHKTYKAVYVTDQLLHILIIAALSSIYTSNYGDVNFLGFIVSWINKNGVNANKILRLTLLSVIIFKPVNTTFKVLFDKLKIKRDSTENADSINNMGGATIGNLERALIIVLLILQQYTAIGLVITGKSIARFNSNIAAEYFIIGTFYSILVTTVLFSLLWAF